MSFEFHKFAFASPDNFNEYLQGLKKIQEANFVRKQHNYEVIWGIDNVKCFLIDSFQPNAPCLLVVPSLINRYYILDLNEQLSLVRHLSNSKINVFLLDWDEPSEKQASFDAGCYVLQYLLPLTKYISNHFQTKIHLMGYCIGGLLGLACSVLSPSMFKSLILLATPWDFNRNNYSEHIWSNFQQLITDNLCDNLPLISGAYLSWLFYLAEPVNFAEKYIKFNNLKEGSEAYFRFLAIENWVNDTVPLTSAFARNCLIDWAQNNATAKGEWLVDGNIITPDKVLCPSLIVAPQYDKIVTPENAIAIATMAQAQILSPATGHIGMIIGRERVKNLWQPLVEWIANYS